MRAELAQLRELTSQLWRGLGLRAWLADTATMLVLVSRLPVTADRPRPEAVRALPLAGAAIGAIGAIILAAALAAGLPSMVAALTATAGLVLATGALHEDGLADTADGFGGGADAGHKLRIMRDSTIGTYGAVVLILALMARVVLTAELADMSGAAAAGLALVAGGALSRGAMVGVLCTLPPARPDGLGKDFAQTAPALLWPAGAASLLIAALCLMFTIGLGGLVAALVAAAAATAAVASLASRQIGGQTGDVCGATQQGAEVAVLAGLVIAA